MKLEIKHRKKNGKRMNSWRLNILLKNNNNNNNNSGSMIKSKRKSEDTETNDNKNTTIPNLLDATKAVLRGKFTAIQPFPKKEEKFRNNLTYHLEENKTLSAEERK